MNLATSAHFLERIGLAWLAPLLRLCGGEQPTLQLRRLAEMIGIPALAIASFLVLWQVVATEVETSLGTLPGPAAVWRQAGELLAEHRAERAKAAAFHLRQDERNAALVGEDATHVAVVRPWTGKPTFFDQILTSLCTVFTGFVLATLIGVPLGLLCGSSRAVRVALDPLIQIFKPVSPLAWLPIVTLLVSALYGNNAGWLSKSFIVSAVTVTLCSVWPTVINTAVGVAAVDRDLLNVARVLQLSWHKRLLEIVLPSALPLIFTGMRLSLGVGWMVLIAAEMLAQNPGLGKFVWDEFQNGSSQSLSRIMVAVLTIGLIGCVLDRMMLGVQQLVDHRAERV